MRREGLGYPPVNEALDLLDEVGGEKATEVAHNASVTLRLTARPVEGAADDVSKLLDRNDGGLGEHRSVVIEVGLDGVVSRAAL